MYVGITLLVAKNNRLHLANRSSISQGEHKLTTASFIDQGVQMFSHNNLLHRINQMCVRNTTAVKLNFIRNCEV